MKRFVNLASVAALTLAVGTIEANSFEHSVELSATVEPACTVGAVDRDGASQTGENSSSYSVIHNNGSVEAQGFNLAFHDVECNTGAVEVGLTSDNAGLADTSPGGSSAKLHYTASAKLGTGGTPFATYTTLGGGIASGSADLGATPLTVSVAIAATSEPLPAGTYSDNLRITINPGP